MALAFGYDRIIKPDTPCVSDNQENATLSEVLLNIRASEARSLYLNSLATYLPVEIELTFMTNMLNEQNKKRVIHHLESKARVYRAMRDDANKLGLMQVVSELEEKAKIEDGAAKYISDFF